MASKPEDYIVNYGEVERLCRYLKNDSLVRWHTGCAQKDIDNARARIRLDDDRKNRRSKLVGDDLPVALGRRPDETELARANKRYLEAVMQLAPKGNADHTGGRDGERAERSTRP